MKKNIKRIIYLLTIVFFFCSCLKPSMVEKDTSAGFNGSFEKIIHGLPANWYIYAAFAYQKTYLLSYDTVNPKEGKQSLKFEVLSVDTSNVYQSWRRPGIFETTEAQSGDQYMVSFWIKNKGCDFSIKVTSFGLGVYPENIVKTNRDFTDWTYFDYQYTIPDSSRSIRLELNIQSPGTFWIDDVRLDKLNETSPD